jgi:copper chaperone CopZ
MKIDFTLKGLRCIACVKLSLLKLKKISGVKNVEIDLATGKAHIDADPVVTLPEIEQALVGTDYSVVGK